MWFFKNKKIEQLEQQVAELKNEISVTDSQAFKELFTGGVSSSISVGSETSAMRCSAVFACVRLISGAIASAPVNIYHIDNDGERELVKSHPFKKMLGACPNEHLTASTFWKTLTTNKVLHGNAYAAIIRSASGRPVSLVPLKNTRCTPYQAWERKLDKKLSVKPERLFYEVLWDNGERSLLDQDDMIHVPNIGWDGKKGLSTISAGAKAMGLALNAEQSAAGLFEHGMLSQVALTYENKMSPDAQDLLREHFINTQTGSANHHNPLILTEGGDVKTLSMNAVDAQLIEARQFSVINICRFFGIDPVLIGEKDKTSSWGSGVEQVFRAFHTLVMNDHYTDIEQEIGRKLFRNSNYVCKFEESELTRGDTKTRAEYNKAAIGGTQNPGWKTVNEIRRAESLPPLPDGDTLYKPVGESNEESTAATV